VWGGGGVTVDEIGRERKGLWKRRERETRRVCVCAIDHNCYFATTHIHAYICKCNTSIAYRAICPDVAGNNIWTGQANGRKELTAATATSLSVPHTSRYVLK
jgi:hypothetical protein